MARALHRPSISLPRCSSASTTTFCGAPPVIQLLLSIFPQKARRLAVLGLTYQYSTCRISRDEYEKYHSIYNDEVSRLNPPPPNNDTQGLAALNADDMSLRSTDELRFALFRHWTLYDAMFHSSYVASKLGIWKEQGRKRLTGLLAKMG